MFLPSWTWITTMWELIAIKAIIGLGHDAIIYFLPCASLATTYCLKFGAILKSWPKVRVCLLSNSCWVISSKIEKLQVILITPVFLIDSIKGVKLVGPIHLIELVKPKGLIDPVGLVNWFLLFEPKFLVRLVLIGTCILAPGRNPLVAPYVVCP
jgi:hypothetical protein